MKGREWVDRTIIVIDDPVRDRGVESIDHDLDGPTACPEVGSPNTDGLDVTGRSLRSGGLGAYPASGATSTPSAARTRATTRRCR
jgi:hypothetical protein